MSERPRALTVGEDGKNQAVNVQALTPSGQGEGGKDNGGEREKGQFIIEPSDPRREGKERARDLKQPTGEKEI